MMSKQNVSPPGLSAADRKVFTSLDSPPNIQAFLDSIPYSDDDFYRCPLRVLRDRKANCFDGALFAAMALRSIGYRPLIMELIPDGHDDDHLLALFKPTTHWGAVAKSNFSGLRYREPVYRDLRELVMSYFEDYFNARGEKTLTAYRSPIDLKVFDHLEWMTRDEGLEQLSQEMDRYPIHPVITPKMASGLAPVDQRSLQAGLMGANPGGLFKVE
jgi:hypothetical protein